jgi:hypothetical protein
VNDTSRHDKPALPADAVASAADRFAKLLGEPTPGQWHRDMAMNILEAAAPAIRDQATAAERARIRQLALAEADDNSMWAPALGYLADLLDGTP